jgi:hypothetical protein
MYRENLRNSAACITVAKPSQYTPGANRDARRSQGLEYRYLMHLTDYRLYGHLVQYKGVSRRPKGLNR